MSSATDAVRPFKPLSRTDGSLELWRRIPGDWRRPQAPEAYDIYRRACDGFGQILPRPDPASIAAFYELDDYYTHRPKQGGVQSTGLRWRILQHLAWRADRGTEMNAAWWSDLLGDSPKRCLEVGCGSGATLETLAGLGHDVMGVEPDPQARTVASGRSISVYDGSAETLPVEVTGQPFDCLIFLHVLEHCADPLVAVENAWNSLAKGGVLVVEVPNNGCLGADTFREAWYWLDVPRHLNFFTRDSLSGLVASAGFEIAGHQHRGYSRQFSETWIRAHRGIEGVLQAGRKGGFADYARLLLGTMFAAPERKYDSIRIIARKPDALPAPGHSADRASA